MTATIALTTERRTLRFAFTLPRPALWRPMVRVREPSPPREFRSAAVPGNRWPLMAGAVLEQPWPPAH